MKAHATAIIASTLLLSIPRWTQAQSQSERPVPGNSFVGSAVKQEGAPAIPAQARQVEYGLDDRLRLLANVVCHEQVERYARRGSKTSQVDTLDVNVEVLEGVEKYSDIRRREKLYSAMEKVPGTWSVGEMAALLSATRDAIERGDVRVSQSEAPDLGRSSVMTFSYPAESRRWYLRARSRLHWLAFVGQVWTSPDTGEIRRISWIANDLPGDTGAAQVVWTVDFSPVDLSRTTMTLPEKALFEVTYRDGGDRVDWNVTRFSEYRRYGAESAIHFNE